MSDVIIDTAENVAHRRRAREQRHHSERLKLALAFALSGAISGMLGHLALGAASKPRAVWKPCDTPELVHENATVEPPLASNRGE